MEYDQWNMNVFGGKKRFRLIVNAILVRLMNYLVLLFNWNLKKRQRHNLFTSVKKKGMVTTDLKCQISEENATRLCSKFLCKVISFARGP